MFDPRQGVLIVTAQAAAQVDDDGSMAAVSASRFSMSGWRHLVRVMLVSTTHKGDTPWP
jgi:hypothetical protein